MRTKNEIIARIEELSPSPVDMFGVMAGLLVFFLPYADARRFLKRNVSRDEWKKHQHPITEERVRFLILAGVRASWKIANERKGVDSNKGFMVLEALCWILGPEHHEWAHRTFWTRGIMAHYGKPQLVELHERYSLGPWRELDDGKWHNSDFDVDLTPDDALRQWHAKWDKVIVGGFGGNGQT